MAARNKQDRRRGTETSATRSALLDAAEQLLCEEGYAAVTARRLASRAGLKPQLVHYYFRSMDDLFVAVIRRGGDRILADLTKALASHSPLRAIWKAGNSEQTARLSVEFLALANHRPTVRTEVKRYAEQIRVLQAAALSQSERGKDAESGATALTSVVLTTAAANLLVLESSMGISLGHRETLAFIEQHLKTMERGNPARQKRRSPAKT